MQAGSWRVLGLMSGSSLDGLDMCLASFQFDGNRWFFHIESAHTQPYPPVLVDRLRVAHLANIAEVQLLDALLGDFFAEAVATFLEPQPKPELISSHGHTIVHQPALGYTLQIGGAATLAARLRLPVVYDFRSADLSLGGQGAPLVPKGDALLFAEYAACLNLGGIANVSLEKAGKRLAWDLAFCNMVLNHFSEKLGQAYDEDGHLARSGCFLPDLAEHLTNWAYYRKSAPKSLGREDFERDLLPLLETENRAPVDVLHTYTLHLGQYLGSVLSSASTGGNILVTGGGAFNTYLMETLQSACSLNIEIPDKVVIAQKEALIFGFLGLLRYLHQHNVLSSVTGSSFDHSAGSLIDLYP